jgi:hypothetical protein
MFKPLEAAGYLPMMLNENDPASVQDQLQITYAHGGGWHSFKGFSLAQLKEHYPDGEPTGRDMYALKYPEDPPMMEKSRATFRNQLLVLFEGDWLGIIENEKLIDVARID